MTTDLAPFPNVRPGSHCDKILRVLADGKWHSTQNLHRKAGDMIVHSRMSELRKRGYNIQRVKVPKKSSNARTNRYLWVDAPPLPPAVKPFLVVPEEIAWPRDPDNRYRIYAVDRYGEQRLVATCADAEAVGVAVVTLAEEGEFDQCSLGLLDTFGQDERPGVWRVNPWNGRS